MSIATGVSMQSEYLMPYFRGGKLLTAISHISNLSLKARVKYEAYLAYKDMKSKGVTMKDIGKIYHVNKSTVSRWIREVENALKVRRYQVLEPRSRAPINTPRSRRLSYEDKEKIIKIRDKYRCGKDKIAKYLKRDYGIIISPSTIHRYITKLSSSEDPMVINRGKVKTRRKRNKELVRITEVVDNLERRAFERFQIDTKYWIVNSRTFYIITAVDVITRMAYARAYSRHTAICARDFLNRLDYLFSIKGTKAYIQRDNGTEFMAEFEEEATKHDVELITNYVRMPKMNGYVERFNRTIKNELLWGEFASTVEEANELIHNYIIKYNFERIHGNIGDITPFERYMELKMGDPIELIRSSQPDLLHNLWTSTIN